MGQGPDFSLYDVYIDGTLWQSFDGYSATPDERVIAISLEGEGLHSLEIRNRLQHNLQSTGYKVRFKSLFAQPAFDVTTIDYTYDALSRLVEADYDSGTTVYSYGYDLAGNLVDKNGVSRSYNAANQMTNDGTNTLTYDANGNLTNDGVNAYTWDRANRMLSAPGSTSYRYDGVGNRVQQTVNSIVTDYLNDVQPGLVKLLALAPGHRLASEQLMEMLWPELDPSSAANRFHQTLYEARRILAKVEKEHGSVLTALAEESEVLVSRS